MKVRPPTASHQTGINHEPQSRRPKSEKEKEKGKIEWGGKVCIHRPYKSFIIRDLEKQEQSIYQPPSIG